MRVELGDPRLDMMGNCSEASDSCAKRLTVNDVRKGGLWSSFVDLTSNFIK